jgi:PAS domain S-box-containing protein
MSDEYIREEFEKDALFALLSEAEKLANVGGWEWDIVKNKWTFSDNWLRIHGFSKRHLETSELLNIAHPDDRPDIQKAFDKAIIENAPYEIEHRIIRQDTGEKRYVKAYGRGKLDSDGKVVKIYGAAQDITQRKQAQAEIERMQYSIDMISDSVFWVDEAGIFLNVNKAACRNLGYSHDELMSMGVADIDLHFTSEKWPSHWEEMKRCRVMKIESTHKTKDGRMFPVEAVIHNQQFGDISYNCVLVRDITERKQAEEKLIESEALFRGMFNDHSAVMLLIDPDTGQIIEANKSAVRYYGYTLEKILQMKIQQLNISSPEQISEQMHSALNKQINIFEFQHLLADGQVRDVEVHSTPITIQNQKSLFSIIRDTTERNRAEEALQKSEERFRNLYDDAPVGYFEYDLQGNITRVNRTELKMLGYNAKEMIGQPCWKFIADKIARDQILDKLRGARPPAVGLERIYRRKDGTTFPVLFEDRILTDEYGHITGIRTAIQDITELKQAEEALRKSEEKHRRLFETMAHGVVYHASDGSIISANPAAERILGLSLDQIRDRSSMDPRWGIIKEDGTEVSGLDYPSMISMRTGKTFGPAIRGVFHPERNAHVWVSITAIPLFQPGETKPFQVYTTFEDITDRKQAEEALKSNYALLQIAGETAKFGGWSVDLEKNICTWSDAVADIHDVTHGYSPPVQQAINFYATEWQKKITQCFNACAKNGISYDEEMEIITQKGKRVWVRTTGRAVKNEKDKIIKVQGSFQDITERKQAEQEYQTLFREMLNGFALHEIICDATGAPADYRFLDVNPAFERMTGLKAQEIVGKTILDILPGTERHWIELYGKVAQKGEAAFFENYHAELNMHFEVTAFRPAPSQFACIFSDITMRKQAEAEREKLQVQLTQAQKMESVGRLAGGVAHDFNNMLGVILGHTELALLQADENHDLYSDLKEIQKAAKRSADTTKQLLAFARKDIISPKQLDLNDTVESMLNMLRRLIGEDIDLVWQPVSHLWPVKMDPSQIDQILVNLCVNARDAIAGVGKLTIETGRHTFDQEYCNEHPDFIPGDFVLLAVSDNGCGMDKVTLDNLFEPFFTTKEVGKGTGLGLATIYGIVKQNNGFINVYSEPGQGSTFKIYLPRLVAEDGIEKAVLEKKVAAGGTETILLVEDEPTILRMTRMMLERKGYSVLSAATPAEAIDLAKTHADNIHLLMTDVVMPEMNGRDLAGQITALYPGIRQLFMSGYTADVIAHQGVLDDGVAFIHKPFSMADMTEKVRELLDMATDKS